ncbi:hypothetical protein ABN584_21075 [Gloeocapsa sp. BRSZ]
MIRFYSPLILSRTQNDARILGSTAVAAGFGGVTGALLISTWGNRANELMVSYAV